MGQMDVYEAMRTLRAARRSTSNELAGIVRRLFRSECGVAGTDFRVALDRSATGYLLVPPGRGDQSQKLEWLRVSSRSCTGSNPEYRPCRVRAIR